MAKIKLNHQFLKFWMAIMATMLCLEVAYAQKAEKKPLKDYRIEVIIDTIQKKNYVQTEGREIRFVSPDGKILKTLPYKDWQDQLGIFVSPAHKCLIIAKDTPAVWEEDSLGQPENIREARVEFAYINAKGEEKWKKNFEIIHTLEETNEDETTPPYFFVFSRDGGRIVFVRNNHFVPWESAYSDIVVFDTLGKEVASVYKTYYIENSGSIQISPDGKIIGVETGKEVDNKWFKQLFFLEVETGRTKLVKAEGEVKGREWIASFSLYKNKEIHLIGGWRPIKKGQSVKTSFDEIPEDLSSLFK